MDRLVRLSSTEDDFGLYSTTRELGPYGTPLVFRGTFEECRTMQNYRNATSSERQ